MKGIKKLTVLVVASLVSASFFGCTTDKHYDYTTIVEGTQIVTKFYTISPRTAWVWNDEYKRYEYIQTFPELTAQRYEQAVVQAGLFIIENDHLNPGFTYEVLKPLPYLQSYPITGGLGDTYTENISFDVSEGLITFHIQASDLSNALPYLNSYEFKVSLIWK